MSDDVLVRTAFSVKKCTADGSCVWIDPVGEESAFFYRMSELNAVALAKKIDGFVVDL